MSEEQISGGFVFGPSRVLNVWGVGSVSIAQDSENPRLVKGNPAFNAVPEMFKAYFSVIQIVANNLFSFPTSIFILKLNNHQLNLIQIKKNFCFIANYKTR